MTIHDRHAKILEERSLDIEVMERLGVESFSKGRFEGVRFPYFDENGAICNWKYRTLPEKDFRQTTGGKQIFWNYGVLLDETLDRLPLVVTEGELDCVSAIQAGFIRSVSVPNGAPAEMTPAEETTTRYEYLRHAEPRLKGAREIILAVDNDPPGINLLNDLAIRLKRARCKWAQYPPGCKDLNDVLRRFGPRGVVEVLQSARWMQLDGYYHLRELPPITPPKQHSTGIVGLDKHYRMRLGDFCVVIGVPGNGKSLFANIVACNAVSRHGWPVCFASFEQQTQTDHRRFLRTWYNRKLEIHQTEEEKDEADSWIDKNFGFIVPSDDDDVTPGWLLERITAAIIRDNAKMIVVDPWNEMLHDRGDLSITEYVGNMIKELKKFTRRHQVHFILIVHPAKLKRENGKTPVPTLYDASDSQHFYNKPDVGIIIHRNDDGTTLIKVAKSRYFDQIGEPGEITLRYVPERATYEDIGECEP